MSGAALARAKSLDALGGQRARPAAPPQPAAEEPPAPLADDPIEWQDDVMHAVMELDAAVLALVLDERKDARSWRDARLNRTRVGGHRVFVFAGRLYSDAADGVREALGGTYTFEREAERATTAAWLEMIGAKTGDSLLHLVLRLNGCDDAAKARLAVELLGRGQSYEDVNSDGELHKLSAMYGGSVGSNAAFPAKPASSGGGARPAPYASNAPGQYPAFEIRGSSAGTQGTQPHGTGSGPRGRGWGPSDAAVAKPNARPSGSGSARNGARPGGGAQPGPANHSSLHINLLRIPTGLRDGGDDMRADDDEYGGSGMVSPLPFESSLAPDFLALFANWESWD